MARFLIGIAIVQILIYVLVLRPLWPRNRILTVALLAVLPLTSMLLYRLLGAPAALNPQAMAAPADMRNALSKLEADLQRDPNRPEGWRLLAQAYAQTNEPIKARDAAARAAKLAPKDPDTLVEAAQARALAEPTRLFDQQAVAWLQQAIQLQPKHQQARWFMGVALRQSGKDAEAATLWESLLADVPPQTAAALRKQIDEARKNAGLSTLPQATPATSRVATPASPSSTSLTVQVQLDPDFATRTRLNSNASVFVIARAINGPPMPVAVEKHRANELPLTVELSDADGPMPTLRLSEMHEVEVLARLSTSGNAMKQPGDIDSVPVRIQLPSKDPVQVVLGATGAR